MSRLRGYEFVIGFFLATAILATVLVLHSDPTGYYEICDRSQPDPKDCTTNHIILFALWKTLKFLNDISNAIIAIATVILALLTRTLARVGRIQIEDTRILQRAYLAVDGGGISPLDMESVAHIGVRNVGNLSAREVSWFIDFAIDPNGRRGNFPIDETKFYGRNIVPPGTVMMRSKNCVFDDRQNIMLIEEGMAHFYVWGEIRYLDGFGKRRFTRFCHRYGKRGLVQHLTDSPPPTAQTIVGQEITAESMRYHQFGNDAD